MNYLRTKTLRRGQKRLFVWAFLFLFTFNLVGGNAVVSPVLAKPAQPVWPTCNNDWNCTAGEFTVTKLWLGDSTGTPISNSCTPGSTVAAYIWGEFNNNAQRYTVTLVGTVNNGSSSGNIDQCVGTIPAGISEKNIAPLDWTCGESVTVSNLQVDWRQNDQKTCDDIAVRSCDDFEKSKCSTQGNITVLAPLIADFTYNLPVCYQNQVNFTDDTTGGKTPYTYSWDFGDSSAVSTSQSPSHTYTNQGTYNVTLTVTDNDSVVDSQTHEVAVPTCSSPYTSSDLSIKKEITAESDGVLDGVVDNGGSVTYEITVTNNGEDDATDVSVSDQLPTGLVHDSDTGGGAYNSTTGIWTIGDLANGASVSLEITVTVDSTPGTEIINTATAILGDTFQQDPDSENNTQTSNITVTDADLLISKVVNNNNPTEGTDITYTITVTNNGPQTANDVVVTDILPTGLTYVNSTPSVGTYNGTTGEWQVGSMASSATETLQITAKVNTLTAGQTIANLATVTSDTGDSNLTNNSTGNIDISVFDCVDRDGDKYFVGSQCTGVQMDCNDTDANVNAGRNNCVLTTVGLTKTAQDVNGEKLVVGDAVNYTLTVTNTGTETAYGVTVNDDLPNSVTCQSVSGDNAPSACADPLTWSVGNLSAGASATLTIGVTINQGTEGQSIINTGYVTGDNFTPTNTEPGVCPDGQTPTLVSDQYTCPNTPISDQCTPGATQDCTTQYPGICSAGTQTCTAGGTWGECQQINQAITEICGNGKDDDCDGAIDNPSTCSAGCMIFGTKYEDNNGNGKRDDGEPGLPGWDIAAQLGQDSPSTTLTNSDGNYCFTNLADGTYVISELKPKNQSFVDWQTSQPVEGTYTVIVSNSQSSGPYDFGNYRPGVISGSKYGDINGNGQLDEGENTISGWQFFLKLIGLDTTNSTTTNDSGLFTFNNLAPGNYLLSEALPEGWTQTSPAATSTQFEVVSGSQYTNNNNYLNTTCVDADHDGYYNGEDKFCIGPYDCNDGDSAIHPGATEICTDQIDNNCDGKIDSQDTVSCPQPPTCEVGQTRSCSTDLQGVCTAGTQTCIEGGTWGTCVQNTQSGAEVCDQLDNNCNGQVDEGNVCNVTETISGGGGGGGGGGAFSSLYIHTEQASSATESSLTISWFTNEAATTRLVYDSVAHPSLGSDSNYGYPNTTAKDSSLVTFHTVTISGLNPGTTYYFLPLADSSAYSEVHGTEISGATLGTVAGIQTEEQPPVPPTTGGEEQTPTGETGTVAGTEYQEPGQVLAAETPQEQPTNTNTNVNVNTNTNEQPSQPETTSETTPTNSCSTYTWILLIIDLILTFLLRKKGLNSQKSYMRSAWIVALLLILIPVILWYPACWLPIWLLVLLVLAIIAYVMFGRKKETESN